MHHPATRPDNPQPPPPPGAARYKMLSPAKLPISRSLCLTVPPGLSPGALPDSPVLLTNIKAEPSPTTGTFSFHSLVSDTFGSSSLCSPKGTYGSNVSSEGNNAGGFEFKPHIRASSFPGLPPFGNTVSVNPTPQEREQIQRQCHNQPLASCQLVQAMNPVHSSNGITLSGTTSEVPPDASPSDATPTDLDPDDLQLTKASDNDMHPQGDNGSPSSAIEKSAEDGYNWRKYGQKHVKGSEFPRSYYKCTHSNCQVKKQLERSHDGQITDVIYKGEHNHPKPEPNRRLSIGTIVSGQVEERSDRPFPLASGEDKLLNVQNVDSNGITGLSPISQSDEDGDAGVGGSNANENEVADDDDPESKRRKMEGVAFDATQMGKTNREPRVVVQTISEVDILDDGYRWRKYGQKVVKGNPNPRSYYKCTSSGCSVRKHVERASHDPKAVITTYEGKHNHDVPAARNSSHDTAAPAITNSGGAINTHMPASMSGMLTNSYNSTVPSQRYSRPEENDMISLDLGVGINANHDKLHQASGLAQNQNYRMMVQATLPNYYGTSSNGLNASRESNGEGFSFRNPSTEHYYPTPGNLVMGP